jgi:hypothetical protein
MPKLEYRLLDEENGYPSIYSYDKIQREEIAARFFCDYFIKEGKVYEKTSASVEQQMHVIYVKECEDEKANNPKPVGLIGGYVILEIREYTEEAQTYRLIQTLEISDLLELLLYIQSNYIVLNEVEWERSSTEIDEDRKVYVMYVTKSLG